MSAIFIFILTINDLAFCVRSGKSCLTLNLNSNHHQHNFEWDCSSKVHKQKHEYTFLTISLYFFKCLGHIC